MNNLMWLVALGYLMLPESTLKLAVDTILLIIAVGGKFGMLPEVLGSVFLNSLVRMVFLSVIVKPIVLIDFMTMKKILANRRKG